MQGHILVADDNADMRAYIGRLLGAHRDVETAEDGNAAIEAIRRNRPDLVVTDAMMPQLDGFGLLEAIRKNPDLRDLPVIMLSARAGEEARIEGLDAGADYYLTKPFSARELVAQVNANLTLASVRSEAARDLRASEEALRRRTTQFETLLNEAPLGVYLVDADFKIQAGL
jgi:DNA-binding response OmpR family regulator